MKIKIKCIALILLAVIAVSCGGKPLTPEEKEARRANQSVWERNAREARGGP